jgi:hypothetical protein
MPVVCGTETAEKGHRISQLFVKSRCRIRIPICGKIVLTLPVSGSPDALHIRCGLQS